MMLLSRAVSLNILETNKSVSQKAVWANKNLAKEADKMYNLGNDQSNIEAYLKDKPIRDKIQSDSTLKIIEKGQQNKHVVGTNEYKQYAPKLSVAGQYGPSRLTISIDEAQKLIDQYSGTGILLKNKDGKWTNTEIITTHQSIIGIAINNITGKEAETTVFKIKYGKNGTHIFPDYPSKKGAKATK
ncbi:MAG: polymorphic toxin type 50 domain-containing protein [Clostridia bacterium]|nr:polymorphic toxin type 50 domain-containing protein [Clostridia bacterium]